jgi:hypothetical protein
MTLPIGHEENLVLMIIALIVAAIAFLTRKEEMK